MQRQFPLCFALALRQQRTVNSSDSIRIKLLGGDESQWRKRTQHDGTYHSGKKPATLCALEFVHAGVGGPGPNHKIQRP